LAHETFRVVGVPSEDPGRAGVSPTGVRGAFKVPTLRNVALTAPYMHNGALATLEDVVQFYADGAGRVNGFPSVDPLLKGFELSQQDKADLVAFLHTLTDISELPPVPEQALSGLPVVPRIAAPAR
jgi:cytochrome c peroxidase